MALSRGKDLRGRVDSISELMDEIVEYMKDRGRMDEEAEDTIGELRARSEELFYEIPLD